MLLFQGNNVLADWSLISKLDIAAETDDEEGSEGISSRFVEYLMHHLLKGVRVKEKLVRLRCCQLIALSTNSLGAMEYDLLMQI